MFVGDSEFFKTFYSSQVTFMKDHIFELRTKPDMKTAMINHVLTFTVMTVCTANQHHE